MDTDEELIGVYDADGGPRGEAAYVVGKFLGRAHCSLCDITHSPWRRKPEWNRMVASVGLPVTLLHRNEVPDDLRPVVSAAGTPVVLHRPSSGEPYVLLGRDDLDRLDGSVASFHDAVTQRLAATRPGP